MKLPAYFQELSVFLAALVADLEKKVPYACALATRRQACRASVSSTLSSLGLEPPSSGLVVTLFNGATFFELSTNLDDPTRLRREALELADKAALDAPSSGPRVDPGEALSQSFETGARKDPAWQKPRVRLDYARELQGALAKTSPKIRNAIAVVSDLVAEELFINRARCLFQRLPRVEEAIQAVLGDGGKTIQLWDGQALAGGLEKLGYCRDRVQPLAGDAEKLLEAARLPPGMYDVVTDPVWSGILAHEAFGHGAETDMFLKERAKGREYLNQEVASSLTTLYDDPSLAGQAGTYFFDHEGRGASPTKIIDQGILKRGMTDLYSALFLNLPRSANGRRESWQRKAYARMTNTYFAPGKSTPEEILASVKDGFYLRYASNGMEDPQGWGIQCEGLWAQRLRDGRLTGEIYSPVIMTGFVPEMLKSISMVGNDLKISGLGGCGKGHKEWVKNTMGGPHLRLRARLA